MRAAGSLRPTDGAGGGGGGGSGVDSFNGRTGAVVPEAGDYAAFYDSAGTAAAAVATHEAATPAHTVSQITDALDKTGDTMSGNLAMGGNNIVGAASVAATGNISAATFSGDLTGNVNGVTLETGGPATEFLDRTGAYSTPPDQDSLTWTFSDSGNTAGGSGLNMAGGLQCNSAGRVGEPVTADCSLISVGWHRGDADASSITIEVYRAGAIQATVNVAVPLGVPEGVAAINVPVLTNDLVGVFVTSGSATLTDLVVRVRRELP